MAKLENSYKLTLRNDLKELTTLAAKLEEISELFELGAKMTFQINLCLDELITNTISYGYNDKSEHLINIDFNLDGNKLTIKLIDDGKSFNPLEHEIVSLDTPLEEKPIGGLGIHFVREMTDSLEYTRIDNNNILTLRKTIERE
ncbi:MAG: serine/threonine-protein kinase RsbW [Bacteroidota bacterium]|nr:serine/threonine-protein kinase RsbW [Bacteroidota bacterium]